MHGHWMECGLQRIGPVCGFRKTAGKRDFGTVFFPARAPFDRRCSIFACRSEQLFQILSQNEFTYYLNCGTGSLANFRKLITEVGILCQNHPISVKNVGQSNKCLGWQDNKNRNDWKIEPRETNIWNKKQVLYVKRNSVQKNGSLDGSCPVSRDNLMRSRPFKSSSSSSDSCRAVRLV